MENFSLNLYRDFFLSLKRGNYKGVFSNAKPLFVISILKSIPGILTTNHISPFNNKFIQLYLKQFKIYNLGTPTPFEKPFFHLNNEPFYTVVLKHQNTPLQQNTPSAKYLRDNVAYAKLDDMLWDLLQDEGNRDYLKNELIKRYLK